MEKEIFEMADYCLNCKNMPCKANCPMQTEIPQFIENLKKENIEKAYEILIYNNIFTYICSKICPQDEQCQKKCTRAIKGNSVEIGKLEEYVNKCAKTNNIKIKIKTEEKKNKKIAVIGSGPAGLSCAYELIKKGYDVTVFEKDEQIGGILRYGIPDFRLNKNILDKVIEQLSDLGVQFKPNHSLGENLEVEQLKKQGYSAIFLGLGAQIPYVNKLTEEKCDNIYTSNEFLKLYNTKKITKNLGKVIVIGGGNVSIDCARAAKRLTEYTPKIVYRRDKQNMPASKKELKDAADENIDMQYLTKVIKANVVDNKLQSVECIKTRLEDGQALDVEGSNFTMEADTLIFAIGLAPDAQLIKNKLGIEISENGLIILDENGQTSVEGIFAGGDVEQKKSTVCKSVAAGKRAANGIINLLEKNRKNI